MKISPPQTLPPASLRFTHRSRLWEIKPLYFLLPYILATTFSLLVFTLLWAGSHLFFTPILALIITVPLSTLLLLRVLKSLQCLYIGHKTLKASVDFITIATATALSLSIIYPMLKPLLHQFAPFAHYPIFTKLLFVSLLVYVCYRIVHEILRGGFKLKYGHTNADGYCYYLNEEEVKSHITKLAEALKPDEGSNDNLIDVITNTIELIRSKRIEFNKKTSLFQPCIRQGRRYWKDLFLMLFRAKTSDAQTVIPTYLYAISQFKTDRKNIPNPSPETHTFYSLCQKANQCWFTPSAKLHSKLNTKLLSGKTIINLEDLTYSV